MNNKKKTFLQLGHGVPITRSVGSSLNAVFPTPGLTRGPGDGLTTYVGSLSPAPFRGYSYTNFGYFLSFFARGTFFNYPPISVRNSRLFTSEKGGNNILSLRLVNYILHTSPLTFSCRLFSCQRAGYF